MPRNISFFLTTKQVKEKTKTVTRRNGWKKLKPGTVLMACEKCQGIKKGGLVRLGPIYILSVRFEPLNAIDKEDCIREGFPEMDPAEFVDFYVNHNKCEPDQEITRIEYEYLTEISAADDPCKEYVNDAGHLILGRIR